MWANLANKEMATDQNLGGSRTQAMGFYVSDGLPDRPLSLLYHWSLRQSLISLYHHFMTGFSKVSFLSQFDKRMLNLGKATW